MYNSILTKTSDIRSDGSMGGQIVPSQIVPQKSQIVRIPQCSQIVPLRNGV